MIYQHVFFYLTRFSTFFKTIQFTGQIMVRAIIYFVCPSFEGPVWGPKYRHWVIIISNLDKDFYQAKFENLVKIPQISIVFDKVNIPNRLICEWSQCKLQTNRRCQNHLCRKIYCNSHSTRHTVVDFKKL